MSEKFLPKKKKLTPAEKRKATILRKYGKNAYHDFGKKAEATNKERYGEGFYVGIGESGGKKSRGGGFAKNPEVAREAGRKGGANSKRGKARS